MSQNQTQVNNPDLRQVLIDFFKQATNIDISNIKEEDIDKYVESLDPNYRIVFRLNSDKSDYIVSIDEYANVTYFFKGEYGGYVSKSSPSQSPLFLITVEYEKLNDKFLYDISRALSDKYPDIQKISVYRIKYKIIEIEAEVIDKKHYSVIKKIKPKGKEYEAETYELDLLLGNRREGYDESKAEVMKTKYASLLRLPLYSVKISGQKAKWDTFYLRLKVVAKVPELVKPASQIISSNDSLEIDLFEEKTQEQPQDQEQTQEKSQPSQQPQNHEKVQQPQNQQTQEFNITLTPVSEKPHNGGYVELYLLDFNLPSKYLAKISAKAEKVDDKTYKIETIINSFLARKVENIRRVAYEQVGRYFANTTIGWVAINEKGVQVARELNEYINKTLKEIAEKKQITIRKQTYEIPEELTQRIQQIVSKYYVKAIKILLNYEDTKYLIENVISQLKEGIEELQEKIEKAKQENKKALAKVYEYNMKYQQLLLESFEEFYARKFENNSSS